MSEPNPMNPRGGRLSHDEVARLSDQVAALTSAGLPLAAGLRACAEEMPGGRRLRSAFHAMAEALDRGASLDQAVDGLGRGVPPHLRQLVQAGARTGRIGPLLGKYATFTSVGHELQRQLWISLVYPLTLLGVALLILGFVCSVLVTSFEAIFRDFGVALPAMTIGLIEFSRLFRLRPWMVFELLGGIVVAVLFVRFALSESIRRGLLGSVPVFGQLWRNTSLSEFCHLLAMMLECDVPLPESIGLAGGGVADSALEGACKSLEGDVRNGLRLSEAMARQRVFPRGISQLLAWAEGSRSLSESLHMAGRMYEARARAQARLVGTIIGVTAVFAVVFIAFWAVVGLFLPLITLISRLSG